MELKDVECGWRGRVAMAARNNNKNAKIGEDHIKCSAVESVPGSGESASALAAERETTVEVRCP